jgi:hypothetical protein
MARKREPIDDLIDAHVSMRRKDSTMAAGETRMVGFYMPENKTLLAAFGEVSIRRSQVDYILRMTIRTF